MFSYTSEYNVIIQLIVSQCARLKQMGFSEFIQIVKYLNQDTYLQMISQ